jgi:hypothetical protein
VIGEDEVLLDIMTTDDDKEALGEDLDELKTELTQSRILLTNINTHVKTLSNIAVAMVLLNVIGFIGFVFILLNSGN